MIVEISGLSKETLEKMDEEKLTELMLEGDEDKISEYLLRMMQHEQKHS